MAAKKVFKASTAKAKKNYTCDGCVRAGHQQKCPKERLKDLRFKLSDERECWSDDPREAQ